jgi:glucose-6-phosphate 1-dehydrogenase
MDHVISTDCTGMTHEAHPDPCAIVIFGASGDLTRRELIPALYELARQDLLPRPFAVVGAARSPFSTEEFRGHMREAVERECTFDEATWRRFAETLSYSVVDFTSPPEAHYADLKRHLADLRSRHGLPDNVLYHLAVPPAFFGQIVAKLDAVGLARSEGGWRRVVIEKPFGTDRDTARRLDRDIRSAFDEEQVYRIDHFLGKETVQNMLVTRFANASLEPVWNRNFIDHVQITVAEDIGIGTRAGFYEKTGVVRDMLQNHLLQLLCMAAIEPPGQFDAPSLRNETVKVLRAVQPVDVPSSVVQGQYGPGTVDGDHVPGYRDEADAAPGSAVSTYAAMTVMVDNWRWAGVPFYLRSGKRLARKLTEVVIQFKPTPHMMFPLPEGRLLANVLAFRLQPEEGILQTFHAKQPGPTLCLTPVTMAFNYAEAFGIAEPPRAYAWLLLDAMEGDQTLFARADWIEEAWRIVDPVIQHFAAHPPAELPNYAAGSWGPAKADAMLARDGRQWLTL